MKKFFTLKSTQNTQSIQNKNLCSVLTSSPPTPYTKIIELIEQCTEAEINQVDSEGVPPIYYAITQTSLNRAYLSEDEINPIIEKFIDKGANIHHPNFPRPLLWHAVRFNYPTVVATLLKNKARVNQLDNLSLLHQAALENSDQVIPLLLAQNNDLLNSQDSETGNTPLHDACLHNNVKAVQELLKAGADLNIQNNDGDTPLHLMARYNQKKAFSACLDHAILKKLGHQEEVINFSLENQEGKTALQVAEEKRYHTMIQGLSIYGNEENTSTSQSTFRPR